MVRRSFLLNISEALHTESYNIPSLSLRLRLNADICIPTTHLLPRWPVIVLA